MPQAITLGIDVPDQEKIRRILTAALQAVDPRRAVYRRLLDQWDALTAPGLASYRRIRVVGAGKAAAAMTHGLLDALAEKDPARAISVEGVIITKHVEAGKGLPPSIRVLPGGHPLPSADSTGSAEQLAHFLRGGAPDDLVFCLISGGGSALMVLPAEGLALEDLQQLTHQLLACGADIGEINTLRKHLDRVKGGGLARLAAPARVATLILSDVIGSPLDVIASGPTVGDPTTYQDALNILSKYRLLDSAPPRIVDLLQRGVAGELPETVKPGDDSLQRVTNQVIASNPLAARAALAQAEKEGFHPLLLTTFLQGEASQVGGVLAGLLKEVNGSGQPIPRPACIVAGGETTVTIRGQGLGGRNQELALGAALLLEGLPDVALVTLGTDGEDGPTDAAGALVTGETLRRARAIGLDPSTALRENDSYHFFAALGDLVQTGPTGTNVNDLVFLFAF